MTPLAGRAARRRRASVAADGSGNHTTVQAAIAAATTGTVITIKAGTYQGQVSILSGKAGLPLQGATGTSADVVITGRVYKSYIEGAVDFIYGNGALVIDSTTIKSLDRASSNNGYITAAATNAANLYGILITRSTLTSTAAAQTVALGRCWHAGGAADAIGQVLVRDSTLGGHLRQAGYTAQRYLAGSDGWNPVQ